MFPQKNRKAAAEEAAKEAGLTHRLMHGTNSFGFTTVNYEQGDDEISFWATDEEEVASSYLRPRFDEDGEEPSTYVREIGKAESRKSLSLASPISEILSELKKHTISYENYHQATNEEIDAVKKDYFDEAVEYAKELTRYSMQDKLKEPIKTIASAKTYDELLEAYEGIKDIQEVTYNGDWFAQASRLLDRIKTNAFNLQRQMNLTPENTASFINDKGYPILISKEGLLNDYIDYVDAGGRGIYELFATVKNPLYVMCNGQSWNNIRTEGKMRELGETATTRQIAKWAYDEGYGTVVFIDVKDTGTYGSRFTKASNVYAFLKGGDNIIKSADTVTYDDNGKVIPLSERFTENKDIRFSRNDDYGYHAGEDMEKDHIIRLIFPITICLNRKAQKKHMLSMML